MSKYNVKRYSGDLKPLWNLFIASAKNATFLFDRDFMEYHADRFEDHSVMVFKADKLVAVLPANRVGETLLSHQGLTYGGLVLSAKAKLKEVLEIFSEILVFLDENQIKSLSIKILPSFYTKLPAQELEYLLFLADAKTDQVQTNSVLDYRNRLPIQKNRLEGLKKAARHELKIIETTYFSQFWNAILIPNLALKHQAKPVHSVEEITQLARRFPKQIRQFNVIDQNSKIVGGATIFETDQVAHVQYISGNEDKQQLGSLDFLFHHLINNIFAHKKYFDFGTSTVNQGKNLNAGLHYWKESFGARSLVQRSFRVETANHTLLKNVLL